MSETATRAAFARQAQSCVDLGSPFMGQLMRLCATQIWPASPVTDRIFAWQGDLGPTGQSVPLRLAGAFHALHLQGHPRTADVYPPTASSDATLWSAVSVLLMQEAAAINHTGSTPHRKPTRSGALPR
ncbi:DUF2332 family protein [Yoonia sp.]|uniref:DUF2332 family protein n=1 Tax=Yoonia sp. TaxID=2212373 RepID=UPI00391B475E